MTPSDTPSPYVGLQPFREEDYPYFFGRERDIRVISSNFREQPLTIVYGASGVGKSSVLRAGVLPHLRADSGAVVVYYNTWQSDSFLEDLTGQCRTALGLNDPEVRLDKLVASGGRRLFLLLDQFEELLLYHQTGVQAEEFDSLLARIVNRSDLVANALIGIREDALSRFDQRFSIRIADLLANTLPLEHLNNDAARRAILEPLRVFNERHGLGANGYSMEPELAEEILRQVQPRQFAEAEVGGAIAPGPGRVETPFLQLVLQRLWKEETKADSRLLRLETLGRIGGAVQIVDKHVNDVLASLPRDRDREIAAKMFRYLVTPSRSKIAQDMESLVGYGEAPEAEVRPVLSWLSDKPESRTLRRLDSPERYEIFHDVLAQPILDWRKKYFAERERIEEVRKRRRLQLLAGAMVLLALVAMCFALIAFDQRRKAREAADLARIENQRTMAAKNEVQAAHAQADATANALQAKQAELAGRTEEAAKFRAAADDATKQAQNYSKSAEAERNKAAGLLEGKDSNYQDAVQQIANLRSERDQLQSRVTSLSTEVEQLRKQLGEKGNPVPQVPQAQQPQPKPAPTRREYEEALKIYRELAQKNPDTNLPDVAMTLNNLGNVDRDQNRLDEARREYEEALKIYRELAQKNPDTNLRYVAVTLNNLGNVDRDQNRLDEARREYAGALKIYRELAQKNPDTNLPDVAMTLNNLGNVDRDQNRLDEARREYEEALEIYQRFAARDFDRFGKDVERTKALIENLPKAN